MKGVLFAVALGLTLQNAALAQVSPGQAGVAPDPNLVPRVGEPCYFNEPTAVATPPQLSGPCYAAPGPVLPHPPQPPQVSGPCYAPGPAVATPPQVSGPCYGTPQPTSYSYSYGTKPTTYGHSYSYSTQPTASSYSYQTHPTGSSYTYTTQPSTYPSVGSGPVPPVQTTGKPGSFKQGLMQMLGGNANGYTTGPTYYQSSGGTYGGGASGGYSYGYGGSSGTQYRGGYTQGNAAYGNGYQQVIDPRTGAPVSNTGKTIGNLRNILGF